MNLNLTKNQIYIISAVVIAVIVWFVFFRKKSTPKVTAMVTPPAKPAESGYYGEQWNWGTGIGVNTVEDSMRMVNGNASNSVAGTMVDENGYNVANNIPFVNPGESGYSNAEWAKMIKVGGGTDWLSGTFRG